MQTKEELTVLLKRLFPDYPDEKIQVLVETKLHDERNLVRQGENVIHFLYAGHIVEEELLQQYRQRLAPHHLQLSFQDINTIISANADDFYKAAIQIYLGNELLRNVLASAAWDTIKSLISESYSRIRGKTTSTLDSSGKVTHTDAFIKIEVSVGKHKKLIYIISNKLSAEVVGKAFAKLPKAIHKHRRTIPDGKKYVSQVYKLKKNGDWKLKPEYTMNF
ncbi:MAG TPA: hypothetical protein VD884_13095 [Ohtaekwangia sp.]|nr:hypothetical protein [Ohtaekwangia sp.]